MSSETATATSSPKKRTRTKKPAETPDTPDGAPVTNLYEEAERRAAAPEPSLAERVRAKAQGHRDSI